MSDAGSGKTIREQLEADEELVLSPFAQKSRASRGRARPEPPDVTRPIFQHDRDRIIHSKAFRRLAGKTQVFLAPEGDHYRTRITHTLEVAQVARTVTRALRLNESLTEAIVMGHDLGHTPFGHAGEKVLAKLMPDGFHHVKQSIRVVEKLERDGQGLNLSVEVRDGILKHSKGKGHIISDNANLMAMTLEGQIVRISDIVAYVNHDLDDAVRGRVVKPRWVFQIGACSQRIGVGPEASRCDVDAGPTIGPDGIIYTGGDGVYAINPDGTLRWRFATGGHVASAPAVLADGTVVAGSQDDLVYGIGPDGAKRWDFRTGGDVDAAPAGGDDGTIYVGSDDRKVYALGGDGTLRWAFTTGGDVRASVAIGNGMIYVGSFDAQLYAIRLDGTLAWTFRSGDRIVSSALVDAKGAILFGSQDDRLYCLEPDGHLRWSVELGGDVDSSPTLAADGTIFVGSDDRKLYALRAPSSPTP